MKQLKFPSFEEFSTARLDAIHHQVVGYPEGTIEVANGIKLVFDADFSLGSTLVLYLCWNGANLWVADAYMNDLSDKEYKLAIDHIKTTYMDFVNFIVE